MDRAARWTLLRMRMDVDFLLDVLQLRLKDFEDPSSSFEDHALLCEVIFGLPDFSEELLR